MSRAQAWPRASGRPRPSTHSIFVLDTSSPCAGATDQQLDKEGAADDASGTCQGEAAEPQVEAVGLDAHSESAQPQAHAPSGGAAAPPMREAAASDEAALPPLAESMTRVDQAGGAPPAAASPPDRSQGRPSLLPAPATLRGGGGSRDARERQDADEGGDDLRQGWTAPPVLEHNGSLSPPVYCELLADDRLALDQKALLIENAEIRERLLDMGNSSNAGGPQTRRLHMLQGEAKADRAGAEQGPGVALGRATAAAMIGSSQNPWLPGTPPPGIALPMPPPLSQTPSPSHTPSQSRDPSPL